MIDLNCTLCGAPAKVEETDYGNRKYVACSNLQCGDYEISKRAERFLADHKGRKEQLREMVLRTNEHGEMLEIYVTSDGIIQGSVIKRGGA